MSAQPSVTPATGPFGKGPAVVVTSERRDSVTPATGPFVITE